MDKKKIGIAAGTTSALNIIMMSYGDVVSAGSTTGGANNYITLTMDHTELCVPEGEVSDIDSSNFTTLNHPLSLSMTDSFASGNKYITEIYMSHSYVDGFEITDPVETYNDFPGVRTGLSPDDSTIYKDFTVTAPSITAAESPATYDVLISSFVRKWADGEWSTAPGSEFENVNHQEDFTVRVEAKNTSPVATLDPSTDVTLVRTSGADYDFDVSATISDEHGHEVDITFTLFDATDDSVVELASYDSVDLPMGTDYVQEHTFENLSDGSYYWTVEVAETGSDVVAACAGEVLEDPAITFTYNSSEVDIEITGGTELSGYVFDDANGNDIFDAGENPIPNVTVFVTDSRGTYTLVSDSNGYFETEVAEGTVTVAVDDTDTDIPAGADIPQAFTLNATFGSNLQAYVPFSGGLADSGVSMWLLPILVATLGIGVLVVLRNQISGFLVSTLRRK